MNKHRKRVRNLRRGAMFVLAVIALLFVPAVLAIVYSDPALGGLMIAPAVLAAPAKKKEGEEPEGGEDFETKVLNGVTELRNKIAELEGKGGGADKEIAELKRAINELQGKLSKPMRSVMRAANPRQPGQVSNECARSIASHFILHCERSGKLEALAESSATRDALIREARGALGIETRTALTTSDIPLPDEYSGEIRELISEFGVVRRRMMPYPIGRGTAKPARMGTRPAFGSIAMSGEFVEKSPTVSFASLESHKIGGLVRLPREIDEQSIVAMGQFLARYGAVEFSRAEDTWGFLADGTATYESVSGIAKIAADGGYYVALAAGKTAPSDATLNDFRALRRKVNKAALNGRLSAYYLDTTWETRLGSFNTEAEPDRYVRLPDGSARLDGYPIVWTDVLEPYGTAAAASKTLCAFGALQFWWFGEHGSPRIDTSEHVFFVNDQLAVRFIEEIDFDYAAVDAVAILKTPAA